jgi:glutaredoxin
MPDYTVYWQPGCTSCLKAREFLRDHGVDFDSVNVREDAGAFARLARLGVKSVPVITRGDQFVLGQDLDDVARFVGVAVARMQLEVPVLVARLMALLDLAAHYADRLPDASLRTRLPGRERTYLDLAYHVPQIVVGFLDAALGGRLTHEHFERVPPDHVRAGADVAQLTRSVSRALAVWWDGNQSRLPATLDTYYGTQPLRSVLERTTWHVAQHLRQLDLVLDRLGVRERPELPAGLLENLPLPASAWDPEVPMP